MLHLTFQLTPTLTPTPPTPYLLAPYLLAIIITYNRIKAGVTLEKI